VFIDAGRVFQSDRLSFEQDDSLLGVGIGFDFIYKRNLNLRVDWGFALEALDSGPVNEGSNRLQFVATILF
jgi:hemolysin activation/secretion protein